MESEKVDQLLKSALNNLFGRLAILELAVTNILISTASQTSNPVKHLNQLLELLKEGLDRLPEETRPHASDLIERMFIGRARDLRDYAEGLAKNPAK